LKADISPLWLGPRRNDLALVANSAFITLSSTTAQEQQTMNAIPLTAAQHAILAKAVNASGGQIEWFPDHIKGGARQKVLQGMLKRSLITPSGEGWTVAAEGYDALGMPRPGNELPPVAPEPGATLEPDVAAAEAAWTPPLKDAARTRAGSKQAEVIRMLQRAEGATIGQICEATGWQQHTVRGFFAGALRKKLGLTLASSKTDGVRVYQLQQSEAGVSA
jgi:hypothetical protein